MRVEKTDIASVALNNFLFTYVGAIISTFFRAISEFRDCATSARVSIEAAADKG